jgi:ABC-2 type transport system permease protein
MAGNAHLIPVSEKSWRRGLNNLLRAGLKSWWGTNTWWIQSLIWSAITLMLVIGFAINTPEGENFSNFIFFSLVLGLFAPIAVVIITQDAIVGEKRSGTAAWILSKPVTPVAFILSKFLSNLVGMISTMVLIPGTVGYLVIGLVTGQFPALGGFYAGLGILALNLTFFLTFSLMLGAIFDHPAAVIAIPLAFQFGQQFFLGILGPNAIYLPWALSLPIGDQEHSVVTALMAGAPVPTWAPVILIAALTLLCFVISVQRFSKQEF